MPEIGQWPEEEVTSSEGKEPSSWQDNTQGAVSGLKPLLPTLFKIIVVLAILGGAYWYFIASVHSVHISISDVDGNPLSVGGTIKQGSSTVSTFTGGSTTANLRDGTYSIVVSASGYSGTTQSIDVTSKETEFAIQLEKNYNLSISAQPIPEKIYVGQSISTQVTIANSGTPTTLQLKILGTGKEFASFDPPTLQAVQGSNIATLTVRIPDNYTVSGKTGDAKTLQVGVVGKKSTQSLNFTIVKAPALSVKTTSLAFGTVKGGTLATTPKEIQIANNDSSDFSDTISYDVSIPEDSTQNDVATIKKWFSFNPTQLSKISAKQTAKIQVKLVNVDSDAKPDPNITGSIILHTSYWQSPEISFTLSIGAATIALTSHLSQTTFNLSKNGTTYEAKTGTLTLTNEGDFAIDNIQVFADPTNGCDSWISVPDQNISTIAAGGSETVSLQISAPSATPQGSSNSCRVHYRFPNPITHAQEDEQTDSVTINT